MGKVVGTILLIGAAAGGGYLLWIEQQKVEQQQQEIAQQNAMAWQWDANNKPETKQNKWAPLLGFGLDALMNNKNKEGGGFLGGLFGGNTTATATRDGAYAGTTTGANGGIEARLRGLIGSVEAPEGYNQVYGGIRSSDQPPRPLTQMTVSEVLAWQDSIDHKYNSEAAGRYQVMEDTLRGLVRSGKVDPDAKYDAKTQDGIADILMNRRGLEDYKQGRISETQFGNNLSQEWASLPVQTGSKKGRSYYAGDGLNKAHLSTDSVLQAIRGLF